MALGTSHLQSIRMNHGMLRSRAMQKVKYRPKLKSLGRKVSTYTTPMATYHHEQRMKKAAARGVRKEIHGYLLGTVLFVITCLMIYGIFIA